MSINELFLDVGSSAVPSGQAMGAVHREDWPGENFPLFGDAIDVIPRRDWHELSADESVEHLVCKIKNQGRWPSCTSNGAAQAFEIIWNLTFGKEHWVEFSPISIYKHCGNSTSGSSVSCITKTIRDVGILPADNPGNREWMRSVGLNSEHVMDAVDYRSSYPRGYESTAAHFRVDETYDIESFDEFATSLLNGWPVLYGRHGHAICGARLVQDSRGRWVIRYANSWGNWGEGGYGYDSEGYVTPSLRSYGAIGYRSVKVPEFMVIG